MSTRQILIAGFGGQGILFAGKFLAYKGLMEDKQVSISDEPVGSPIVSTPDLLVAMTLPSLDKYESTVAPGGTIIVDSTLIERKVARDDVNVVYIPATGLASENGMPTLANMIIVGKILKIYDEFNAEGVNAALGKVISARHQDMLQFNLKAMELGADA